MVLGGKADAKMLDSYNEERLENAENLLKTTDRFFNFVASPEPILTLFANARVPVYRRCRIQYRCGEEVRLSAHFADRDQLSS